jgi:dUTP pyrophosphatase
MIIPIKRLSPEAKIPVEAKPGDAGRDAYVVAFKIPQVDGDVKTLIDVPDDSYVLKPLERVACQLGFATAIPEGYYFHVVPRSGLALWSGLSIVNTPGTIDEGYRNEWMAVIVNLSNEEVTINKNDRICQIILAQKIDYEFEEVDELPESERGLGGFGSTGKD